MDKTEKTVVFIFISVILACGITAGLGVAIINLARKIDPAKVGLPAAPTPTLEVQVLTVVPCDYAPEMKIGSVPLDEGLLSRANATEEFLQGAIIPTADLNKLVERFKGKTDVPTHLETEPINYALGDRLKFYILDGDNNSIPVYATLRYATENVYFWAEEGLQLDKRELKNLMDTFSEEIYPTDQQYFGKEWIPGVDNDPHLFILYSGGLGNTAVGYTATNDYVLPMVQKYSNAHEIFMINADLQTLTDPYTLSVMAHELQHLIHGYHDPNEELWLNEGFSELAVLLNGYDTGGFDTIFASDPDMQLNNWSVDPDQTYANYGASFLYTTYLLDRFGDEVTRAVIADPENGFVSVDNVLSTLEVKDPGTGQAVTADDLFSDWTIANFVQDPSFLDGRYSYSNYPAAPKVDPTEFLSGCSNALYERTVNQFGADYYQIDCSGLVTLSFSGEPTVGVLPDSANSEGFMMWSNRADTSDMTMTKEFDFTNISGPLSLTYNTWFDLETGFDYVYLLASVDGDHWQIVKTPSCISLDPSGNNYGCGYNGSSDGWQNEVVDLSRFAGRKVTLRFEYVTDGAVSGEGFTVDDLSISEIGYSENFEENDGGWVTEGFVRIQNLLPQTFLVSLLSQGSQNPVQKFQVKPGERISLDIDLDCFDTPPILIVSGSSRYTRQLAGYNLEITSP